MRAVTDGEEPSLSPAALRTLAELMAPTIAKAVAAAVAQPAWLTPAEAAEVLSVPAATLAQWRYRGQGPVYSKVGSIVRYRRDALDNWLAAAEVQPHSA
ncbi:helix-turn-helix domain-containing protein [Tsukamurella pulmonis]|uniref:helix-turn-helix domain-containing protein n=1 Tax=Tsukamurella pulmonis TaxID=47312 RepID=UPI001EDF349A|nr:helix-turn-helix domain-containing protein [Tsukamurella pulmonis]